MNVAEFFAMGGHGFFIWGSYGVAALLMIAEIVLVVRRKRHSILLLKRMKPQQDTGESA